jgi:hypothetical protein
MDMPDDLFRQVKAAAALRGMKMKDLLSSFIEDGLRRLETTSSVGQRTALPSFIRETGRSIQYGKNSVEDTLLTEDIKDLGLFGLTGR